MSWFPRVVSLVVVLLPLTPLSAGDAFQSGPAIGQRPKPFSVIGVTGPNRGQTYCYVCEAADRPIVILFARSINPQLSSLVKKLDEALVANKAAELRSWVVFLTESRGTMEPKIDQLARQNSIGNLPLTLVEDRDGPPAYRIHHDAEVTVVLSVEQQTVATYAFKSGELTDAKVNEIMASVPKLFATGEPPANPAN